jgi:hypothetical protein
MAFTKVLLPEGVLTHMLNSFSLLFTPFFFQASLQICPTCRWYSCYICLLLPNPVAA